MSENKNIDSRLEQILNSIDGAERTGPGPFFFTRVQARLERKAENAWDKVTGFIAKPVIAMSVLALIIAINGLVAFGTHNPSVATTEQQEQVLPEEYNATVASLYDYETDQP